MGGYVFHCKICDEEPDYVERQPVALPACGHSLCRVCLIHIRNIERQLRCPFCRTLHEGRCPEELPINYALLEVMQSNESNSNGNPSTCEASTLGDSYFDYNYPEKNPTTSLDSSAGETEEAGDSEGHQASNTWKRVVLGTTVVATAVLAGVVFKGNAGALRSLKEGYLALVAAGTTGYVALQSLGSEAAGSYAASVMSSAAFANGGGVAAGSTVAALQSVGAAGFAGASAAGFASASGVAIGSVSAVALATAFSKRLTRSEGEGNEAPGNADVITSDDGPRGFGREEDYSEDDDANSKKSDKQEGTDSDTHNGSSKYGGEREGGTRTNDSSRNIYVPGRGHRRVIYLHEILYIQQI